jgi:hypothetical protein
MSIEAVEAVVELIEMGAVVGNPAIVRCLRSALNEPQQPSTTVRTWVGLTDEDSINLTKDSEGKSRHWLAWHVEQKLKEKNT